MTDSDLRPTNESAAPKVAGAVRFEREPTTEDLTPSPRQLRALEDLVEWEKRSARAEWIVGRPMGR